MPPPPQRRRQRNSSFSPFQSGDRIRAVGAIGMHSYESGRIYTVAQIDESDQTLRAVDSTGSQGNWIKWRDCAKASEIGWEWLKTALPAEALDLLSAFDGLDRLQLREDIRNRLVLQIPGLHNLILEAQADEETEMAGAAAAADKEPSSLSLQGNSSPFDDLD